MRIIEIDASGWKSISDFYDVLLLSLGAPDWHGRNVNALADSMICGGINALEPPYAIYILNASHLAAPTLDEITAAATTIAMVRADRCARTEVDVEVTLELSPKWAI